MPRYMLIRHGESVWNGERRIQGNQDPALSDRGRRQADLLVAGLTDRLPKSVAAVYTSPLRRAAETAGRIAEAFDLPISEAGADLAPRDVLTDSEMAASSF